MWQWLLTLYLQSHHVACCRRLASCIHCISAARKKVLSNTMLFLCTNSNQQEWHAANGFQTFVTQNSNIFFMLWGLVEDWFQLSGHTASCVGNCKSSWDSCGVLPSTESRVALCSVTCIVGPNFFDTFLNSICFFDIFHEFLYQLDDW